METPPLPVPGGCNCGKVRYRLIAAPLACYVCHCHLCQKRTGSAFSLQLVLSEGALEITRGDEAVTERILPDGRKNISRICPSCHSRVSTRREGTAFITLRAGTFDDTAWLRPQTQIWTSSAQPWALIQDIPSWTEQPADYLGLVPGGSGSPR